MILGFIYQLENGILQKVAMTGPLNKYLEEAIKIMNGALLNNDEKIVCRFVVKSRVKK